MLMTTLCYIEHEGHVLLLHRTKKEDDINEGKWIGVGGKFDEWESPEECLQREVREETGYALTSWRFRGIVTFLQEGWESEYMCLYTADDFLVPARGEFVDEAGTADAGDQRGEFVDEAGTARGEFVDEAGTANAGDQTAMERTAEQTATERSLFDMIPVGLHPAFTGKAADRWPVPECAEGELAWIAKEEIRDLPMWEGDRIFFDLIDGDRDFFSLRLEYSGDDLVSVSLDGRELS